jgi:hypothetical protein
MSESDQHDDGAHATDDQEIVRTTEADSSAARLFDVRRVIGGLFTVYGVLVLGAGILDGSEASDKAAGIDINVWTGIGMLALGLLMLLWMRLSPTAVVQEDGGSDTEDDGRG